MKMEGYKWKAFQRKIKTVLETVQLPKYLVILTSSSHRKHLSEVGFEPTPTFVDQNTPVRKSFTLESGALDRSAILTCQFRKILSTY